jgi:hypothetical protein
MGLIDQATQEGRRWEKTRKDAAEQIVRAAHWQAQNKRLASFSAEATRAAGVYQLAGKTQDWREFGDVALHLVAGYLPDLAYFLTYALRELEPPLGYDPVPYVFTALQNLHRLRPQVLNNCVEPTEQTEVLFSDSQARGRAAAALIAREISVTPLRYASGIFNGLQPPMQKLVSEEMEKFNPVGMQLLRQAKRAYLATPAGLLKQFGRTLFRLLFGKDE